MKQKAVVVFQIPQRKFSVDLEIPLDITAKELVAALNAAYELGIDTSDIKNCYLQAENPIALLRGGIRTAQRQRDLLHRPGSNVWRIDIG